MLNFRQWGSREHNLHLLHLVIPITATAQVVFRLSRVNLKFFTSRPPISLCFKCGYCYLCLLPTFLCCAEKSFSEIMGLEDGAKISGLIIVNALKQISCLPCASNLTHKCQSWPDKNDQFKRRSNITSRSKDIWVKDSARCIFSQLQKFYLPQPCLREENFRRKKTHFCMFILLVIYLGDSSNNFFPYTQDCGQNFIVNTKWDNLKV